MTQIDEGKRASGKIKLEIKYQNRIINHRRINPKNHTVTQIEEEERASEKK